MKTKFCPCGRLIKYEFCCGAIHNGISKAITAEDLMRSRYVAFTLADGDYLMTSHHSSTRPLSEKRAIVKWAKSVEWIKLEVLNTFKGAKKDTEGRVEFKAYFKTKDKIQFIHENSMFVRENEQWVYLGIV